MTTSAIRQKLYEYIKEADDKKVKAFYTLIIPHEEEVTEWWQDKKLVEELERRYADMESGKDKGVLWEDAKKQLLQKLKK